MREIRNESVRERILRNPLYLSGESFTLEHMKHQLRAEQHAMVREVRILLKDGLLELRGEQEGRTMWLGKKTPAAEIIPAERAPVECLPRFLIHHASPWSR